jgi:predicted nucleotidyltransferase
MRRQEVIDRLRAHEGELRARGVGALFLFGSHARDEARPGSDVDLFFDRLVGRPLSLFDLMDLQDFVSKTLGAEADVMTRTSLHPDLSSEIIGSSVRVF